MLHFLFIFKLFQITSSILLRISLFIQMYQQNRRTLIQNRYINLEISLSHFDTAEVVIDWKDKILNIIGSSSLLREKKVWKIYITLCLTNAKTWHCYYVCLNSIWIMWRQQYMNTWGTWSTPPVSRCRTFLQISSVWRTQRNMIQISGTIRIRQTKGQSR